MNNPADDIDTLYKRVQLSIDQAKGQKVYSAGDIVQSVDAITAEWLTDVLFKNHPEAKVTDFKFENVSDGTHARDRLFLTYNDAGQKLGLPATMFSKSLPTVENRMIAGITGHAKIEGKFYTTLRPELNLEIPHCYYSQSDPKTFAAIHLLEDMVATKQVTFTDYRTYVTREMAEDMVTLLASLHGHFYNSPKLETEINWAPTYDRWFVGGVKKFDLARFTIEAFNAAEDIIPERLMAQKEKVWPATVATLWPHRDLPLTYLHSDVHIGNWYQTSDGRMGLCDWQCASKGHWSRDLAYALSAGLEIEDRRNWEEDLIRIYLNKFEEITGEHVDFEEAFNLYALQMFHALYMWTITLTHSGHLPDMQSEDTSRKMIERMTAAINDLDAIKRSGI